MAEDIFCKQLMAVYGEEKLFLEGPIVCEIELNEGYHVKIEQCGVRTITISRIEEVSVRDLYTVLSRIVRLMMIFDGRFYKLNEIKFSQSQNDKSRLDGYACNLMRSRLAYFDSHSACGANDKICSFDDVLTSKLYDNWVEMLEELDISHQVYLYSLSASKTPVDLKVAFLIELAEPLIELVKKRTGLYASIHPGKRDTPLIKCLDTLIKDYGQQIFKREIEENYDSFLRVLVNSRVRIMHIKKNQKGIYLDGSESVLYMLKFSLLYRYILLSLLGIDKDDMLKEIKKAVVTLDRWNDTLIGFISRIQMKYEK